MKVQGLAEWETQHPIPKVISRAFQPHPYVISPGDTGTSGCGFDNLY